MSIDPFAFDRAYESGLRRNGLRRQQRMQAEQSEAARNLDKVYADTLRDFDQQQPQPAPMQQPPGPAAALAAMQPAEEKGIAAPAAMPQPSAATPGFNPNAPSPATLRPAPIDPRRRLVGNLARSGVRGSGAAAFQAYGQVQQREDQIERLALTALAKGDDLTYRHFAGQLGRDVMPPEVLADAKRRTLFASGAINAEKLYKANPQQAHAFMQAWIQSGGNPEAAMAAAGVPMGGPIGKGVQNFIGADGREFAGTIAIGPDGQPIIRQVQMPGGGPVRLAPTGRARGTGAGGAGAGPKPMTYGQLRTRALAELRAENPDRPVSSADVDARAMELYRAQMEMAQGGGAAPANVPPAPLDRPEQDTPEQPGVFSRAWRFMFGGDQPAEAAPAPAPSAAAPAPQPAAPPAGGQTRRYVPGQGFVTVGP